MADDKKTFEVDGKKYAVRKPTVDEIRKANEVRSKAFNEALQRGDMLREQLESELRKESCGVILESKNIKIYARRCLMVNIS